MPTYHLAIDIGASSGRAILGWLASDGRLELREVHRFDNAQCRVDGHDCWDVDMLLEGILDGLARCHECGCEPATMGIDTWGVDFVLLDADGRPTTDAVAYRDARTHGIYAQADALLDPTLHYRLTGIQRQPFNTVYQLLALAGEHPEQVEAATRFLMMPEYLNYLLTGVMANEYTNATTTGMLNARTKDWESGVLEAFGIPAGMFERPVMPGATIGGLLPRWRERVGFDAQVMLPATHDTGSGYLAIPATDADAVYISSGTWSLLGVENEGPITSDAARLQNFTNEGGFQYRFRFLKNIMGLWMIQSIRRELNGVDYVAGKGGDHARAREMAAAMAPDGSAHEFSFPELAELARGCESFTSIVNVNDDAFLAPDSMVDAVCTRCRETGQAEPQSV
ncbi:MAG: rhamnulokinase, partial [Coriobacteriia bacterium]|nr:rhamnulokinase [Coriobacteriia bacterium]